MRDTLLLMVSVAEVLRNIKIYLRFLTYLSYHGLSMPARAKKNPPFGGGGDQTTTVGVVDRTYSKTFSGVDHS